MFSFKKRNGKDKGDLRQTETTIAEGICDVQIGHPRQTSRASVGSSFGGNTLSPNRLMDPLGLTILYEPETTPSLDIIFVHGLGGSSRATWSRGHDPEFFWPHKWLPLEPGIQSARISSFGYDANFAASGPTPITNITDFAKDLLYAMKFAKDRELEEANIGERPIIFIVHSMGGLVVKKAYILGRNDDEFSGIVSSITAILFLATPHRGTNLAELLNRILSVSIFNHSPKLYISELKQNSRALEDLNEQFRHIAPSLQIISFYETLPTTIGPKKIMVLEKDSSILGYPGEISKSLNADHHQVCKFNSTQDSNYISIRNVLQTLVNKIQPKAKKIPDDQGDDQALATLLATSQDTHDDLDFFRNRWTSGTCSWIRLDPVFSHWLNQDSDDRFLWLHALPASGKSVLASFIITELLKEDRVCAYYFFRFGDQTKRSLSNCLRSIAYQTAEQLPSFRKALFEMNLTTAGLGKLDARGIWQRVFVGALFKQRFSWPIYWVIDALDEADDRGVLLELIQTIPSSLMYIKILLVSRQTTELVTQFDRLGSKILVGRLVLKNSEQDIRTYVESEINYLHALADYQIQIIDKLLQGAHNNFLWVNLVLKEILECNTMEDLEDVLEGLPPDMEHLYRRMEDLIGPKSLGLAKTILTWAACSRRPLTMDELAEALKPEFTVIHELDVMINRVCGQFVVVDSTKHLIMVHQTVREYLMRSTNSRLAISSTESHEKLFAKCILMLGKMPQRHDSERGDNSAVDRFKKQPFSYAITSWAYHLNLCSAGDKELKILSKFLQSPSVLTWISALAHIGQLKRLVYASKSLNAFVQRMRKREGNMHPPLHRLEQLELTELWATDFLKILGKFGTKLADNYTSIQQHIAPFCPRGSMIYQKFGQKSHTPFALSIKGLSGTTWDDSLARLSLGNGTMLSGIRCSGSHIAILASGPTGKIMLYNALTFETKYILAHGEFVMAMSFSNKGDHLVSYGFRTTKVWDLISGSIIRQIPNPSKCRTLDISFSPDDTAIFIGSEDHMVRTVELKDPQSAWSLVNERLLKDDIPLDRSVSLVPYKMAFDTDLKHVAVAYRGSPLSVWSINPPELIGRCLREGSQLEIGNSWTVVDQVKWRPRTEEILGLYQGGHVFKWHPYNGAQMEVNARASLIACSPEGILFATGDHNGTIKLFNFDDFSLIYQLPFQDILGDITFGPDSKRLYDLRGQFCNVWEPNALIRLEETDEPDSEMGSEEGSSPISEVIAEIRDPITAMSVQPHGSYHATGNDSGIVSVVDTRQRSNNDYDANCPMELWRSSSMMPIINLDWSEDLKHLACGDLTGRIVVLSVNPPSRENLEWISKPISYITIELDGGIWQALLNHNATLLMVENGSSTDIWSLNSKSIVASQPKANSVQRRQWMKHPIDNSLLLALNIDFIRVYRWESLDEVLVLEIGRTPSPVEPQAPVLEFADENHAVGSKYKKELNRPFKSPASSHILMQSTFPSNRKSYRKTFVFDTTSITSILNSGAASGTIEPLSLPPEVQSEVEILLAILPRKGLIFLDKDYWMCSWKFGTRTKLEKVQRHFFLPKDWLNGDCLNLCALLECGTFLMPKNGEVAIIKSGVMSGR